MSSILKALKKLEDEKTTLQDEKEINVSREILKRSAKQGISARWLWLFGSSAIIVIIILTLALIRKPSQTAALKSRELQAAPPLPPLQELLVSPPSKNSDKTQNITTLPLSSTRQNSEPSRQLPLPARETITIMEKSEQPKTLTPAMDPAKLEPAAKTPPSRPTVNSEATLTLSGIAWNRDSADRLAIINGQPAATGATISGAVVEEIMQDKVKLSRNGHTFELLIGRSARID